MELTESIESLNSQLIDLFGIDTVTGLPIWRISWSESQFEKRRTNITPAGIQLLTPQVFEVPKYPYVKAKYVLERLVVVPELNQDELPTNKLSYEPIFVFQTSRGEYIPPIIGGVKFVIDTVYAAMGKSSLAKYIDSEKNTTEAGRQARISELQEELFGNETDVGDALAYKEGVTVPGIIKES